MGEGALPESQLSATGLQERRSSGGRGLQGMSLCTWVPRVRRVKTRWSRQGGAWRNPSTPLSFGTGGRELGGRGVAWLGVVPGSATGHLQCQGGVGASEEGTWLCRASCSERLPQEQRLPGTSAVAMATVEVPTC